ncbi:MAG: inorganic phosphate transporter [Atopobiaceae bacterium]|nr:inorganic phosphate transporter [Atopobiaceae bacterium]
MIGVLVAAFVFEFINGFHDTANAIATTVYTRALPPRVAILLSATMNLIGALTSDKVAQTVATGLLDVSPELYVILAALVGAIAWDLFTWWRAIPSSSSHALIGSLIGATMVYTMSTRDILWQGVLDKVVIPLFTSPLVGMLLGFLLMRLVFTVFANWTHHHANALFHKLQVVSAMFMAYAHGSNDAQKTMGIITLALVTSGVLAHGSDIPFWVKLFCACTMALGTSIGGRRVMKTVGRGVTKLEPVSGFVSETSSAIAITFMTAIGAPVSTTQVITCAIMGTGSARRVGSVKWGVVKDIAIAWVLTLPATIILGAATAALMGLFL